MQNPPVSCTRERRHLYSGLPRIKRPVIETALSEWMKRQKLSAHAFGRLAGLTTRAVLFYMRGQSIPSLVVAFRIEAFSEGKVPAASWLAVPIAKAQWDAFEQVPGTQAASQRRRVKAWKKRNAPKLNARAREKRLCERLAADPLLQMEG